MLKQIINQLPALFIIAKVSINILCRRWSMYILDQLDQESFQFSNKVRNLKPLIVTNIQLNKV